MRAAPKDDFRRTAETFMVDASKLYELGSYRNACYLAGYVFECVLKVLIEAAKRKPETIHDLVSLRESAMELSIAAGIAVVKYGEPMRMAPTLTEEIGPSRLIKGKLRHFCHWDPHHRYDGSRWTAEKSAAYLGEVNKALGILTQMLLDGVLE